MHASHSVYESFKKCVNYLTNIHLPCSIHVARKLSVLNELSFVDALLHGLSGCEVIVCGEQRVESIELCVENNLSKQNQAGAHYSVAKLSRCNSLSQLITRV